MMIFWNIGANMFYCDFELVSLHVFLRVKEGWLQIAEAMIRKWIIQFIYKPNSSEMYWGKIIPSIIVVVGFMVLVYFNNIRLDRLKDERKRFKRYAIGVTLSEHNNIKGGMVVDYEYFFAQSKHLNSNTTSKWFFNKPNTQGGRYYVQFAYTTPSNAEILFNYPVPDSITNSPDSGWEYMPGYKNESSQ